MKTSLPIHDVTPFTLQDFPGRTACIVWFAGCNMRCPYCHNPRLVSAKSGRADTGDVLAFLEKRRGLLDGVVLSGGEATLYKDLPTFARTVKSMGFSVKLDTNGTRPDMIRPLLEDNLLDYVALDYKAPATKYTGITRHRNPELFFESLDLLIGWLPQDRLEIRVTVHTDLLDEKDVNAIAADLARRGYNGKLHIQNFRHGTPTLARLPTQSRMLDIRNLCLPETLEVLARNF